MQNRYHILYTEGFISNILGEQNRTEHAFIKDLYIIHRLQTLNI